MTETLKLFLLPNEINARGLEWWIATFPGVEIWTRPLRMGEDMARRLHPPEEKAP